MASEWGARILQKGMYSMDTVYKAITLLILLGALVAFGRVTTPDTVSADARFPNMVHDNRL